MRARPAQAAVCAGNDEFFARSLTDVTRGSLVSSLTAVVMFTPVASKARSRDRAVNAGAVFGQVFHGRNEGVDRSCLSAFPGSKRGGGRAGWCRKLVQISSSPVGGC